MVPTQRLQFFAKKPFEQATIHNEYNLTTNTNNIKFEADINHLQT